MRCETYGQKLKKMSNKLSLRLREKQVRERKKKRGQANKSDTVMD